MVERLVQLGGLGEWFLPRDLFFFFVKLAGEGMEFAAIDFYFGQNRGGFFRGFGRRIGVRWGGC